MSVEPRQRDVWFARLEPVQGGEQGGSRPVVLLSRPIATTGQPVVLCVPLTRTDRGTHLHVRIDPPEGQLHDTSYAMPEMTRAISTGRLVERWGTVRPATLAQITGRVGLLMRSTP